MKKLQRDYTILELDRGDEMQFHPCNGAPRVGNTFYVIYPTLDKDAYFGGEVYSHLTCYNTSYAWPRIGDGKPRSAGDSYLDHWKFDPFTGEKL